MSRFKIRRIGWDTRELSDGEHPFANGEPVEPYGLWDTQEHCWVDKFGKPDEDYWAASKDIAVMRRRDLNRYYEAKF